MRMSHAIDRVLRALTIATVATAAGCASSYTVPGGPANIAAMGKPSKAMNAYGLAVEPEPMAHFPAVVAIARVQASGYQSYSVNSYGEGAYSVVTTRDVESDDTFDQIGRLPGIAGITPLNRLLLPPRLNSEADLRAAAARVKADVLVIYTFDTQFYDREYAAPLSLVTLGLSPSKRAFVTTTATALITDARTGYVYGGAETTDKSDQIANSWTTEDAIDDARRRTEGRAFDKLVSELEKTWPTIVARYSPPTGEPAATMPTASH